MSICCTFPGKYGDLLWALPTVRAIARTAEAPVDLAIAGAFASIAPLLQAQPYIRRCIPLLNWQTRDTAPISPRIPPGLLPGYDRILHLGYQTWPTPDLLRHTLLTAVVGGETITEADLALEEPWIVGSHIGNFAPWGRLRDTRIAVGFSDEHFELKYGVTSLVEQADLSRRLLVVGDSPRWREEAGEGRMSWAETVASLQQAQVFLGCCSALHVLAVACGVPVVLMEPNPQRHNDVFYPLGTEGRVTLVRGGDGLPTFDARHVNDAIEQALEQALERAQP